MPLRDPNAAYALGDSFADLWMQQHNKDGTHSGGSVSIVMAPATNAGTTTEGRVVNTLVTSAGATLTTFAEVVPPTMSASGLWHMFAHVDGSSAGIYEMTSPDGLTWDPTTASLVLAAGTQTWEDVTVGVPTVWKEGVNWHMLYAGTGTVNTLRQIGYAKRTTNSGVFTRQQATPVIAKGSGTWDATDVETGPGRVIKVGSTYYAFYSTPSGQLGRATGVATSTDLLTWTKDAANPIWKGGRFCGCVWKDGGIYYYLTPHYRGQADLAPDLELWASPNPQFYARDRVQLGILLRTKFGAITGYWDNNSYDTPSVPCDDITKTTRTCTGGLMRMYYAGKNGAGTWLMGARNAVLNNGPPSLLEVANPSVLGTWAQAAVPAGQAATAAKLLGGGTTYGTIAAPFSGYLTGIALLSDAAITAGSITFTAVINGVATVLATLITTGTFKSYAPSQYAFPVNAGDLVTVTIASAAGLLPAAAANVTVQVLYASDAV